MDSSIFQPIIPYVHSNHATQCTTYIAPWLPAWMRVGTVCLGPLCLGYKCTFGIAVILTVNKDVVVFGLIRLPEPLHHKLGCSGQATRSTPPQRQITYVTAPFTRSLRPWPLTPKYARLQLTTRNIRGVRYLQPDLRMADSKTTLSDRYFSDSPAPVSKALCKKAATRNGELTQAERWLFLSQGVLHGQLLADPKSLTPEQMSRVLCRPPLDVLAWNIKTTTGLSSVAEVIRDYWNPDRTKTLGYYAHECITMQWWTMHTARVYDTPAPEGVNPAVLDAATELACSLVPEECAFEDAVRHSFWDKEPSEAEMNLDAEEEQSRGKSTEEWWVIANEHLEKTEEEDLALRERLCLQLDQELRAATATELAEIKPLLERMASEVAEDNAQEAAEAKAKEIEERRERQREKDDIAHKRQRKAAEKEERNKKKQKQKAETAGGYETGNESDSGSSSDDSGHLIRNCFDEPRMTREEARREDEEAAKKAQI